MKNLEIGRKVFYLISNGNIILITDQSKGLVKDSSIAEIIKEYKELAERTPESFDFIELRYGEYDEDFSIADGYRVNPETKELEFSYPDPNEPEVEQPYQAPLSVEVKNLKNKQSETDSTLLDFMETVLLGGL